MQLQPLRRLISRQTGAIPAYLLAPSLDVQVVRLRSALRGRTVWPSVWREILRRLAYLLTPLVVLAACASSDPLLDTGLAYVENREFRREALEESIVNPENGYSMLRLEEYAREDETGWEALPIWNPEVRAVTLDDVGAFVDDPRALSDGDFAPVYAMDSVSHWSRDELLALGEHAFENFPLQIDMDVGATTNERELLDRFGVNVDETGRIAGLVRVRLPDGGERFATTCARCHSARDREERFTLGIPNSRLDRDAIAAWVATGMHMPNPTPSNWGPGRVDVTPDAIVNPTAIPDLRGIRYQSHLHWAGTLRNSPAALAVRTETLIITSLDRVARPPREVAFAIAYYLWSLGERGDPADESLSGAAVFHENCASCHGANARPAPPVLTSVVGTEPSVAASPDRRTGHYRIPSLWGVGDRRQFFHDAEVRSLEDLLSEARLEETPGHLFGLDLQPDERDALIAYLRTLGVSE